MKIENLASEIGKEVRIYFKNTERFPMFGKFVICKDHEELLKKRMIRFVSVKNMESFTETGREFLTKIMDADQISSLFVVNEKLAKA